MEYLSSFIHIFDLLKIKKEKQEFKIVLEPQFIEMRLILNLLTQLRFGSHVLYILIKLIYCAFTLITRLS